MPGIQVAFASRHGGTAGIAKRIAEVLRAEGSTSSSSTSPPTRIRAPSMPM